MDTNIQERLTRFQNHDKMEKEIELYLMTKSHWLSKVFSHGHRLKTFMIFAFISIGFYFIGLFLTVLTLSPLGIDINKSNAYFSSLEVAAMPVYLFAHFIMIGILGISMNEAILVIPRLLDVQSAVIKKSIDKTQNSLIGFLFGLPFIIYDTLNAMQSLNDPDKVIVNPMVHLWVLFSWIIEWIIFGAVIYALIRYIFIIWDYTHKYSYGEQILTVVYKDGLDPLVRLNYTNSIALGFFMLVNLTYMYLSGAVLLDASWYSDILAVIIIFLLLPCSTIIPMQIINADFKEEKKKFMKEQIEPFTDQLMSFTIDRRSITNEAKLDLLVTSRIIQKLDEHKRNSSRVYLRLFSIMSASTIGMIMNAYQSILQYLHL